ncbi:MAG: TIR domain-containing protein [Rhodomicrobium sp.]
MAWYFSFFFILRFRFWLLSFGFFLVGGPKGGAQQPRARQNVILELGYFTGKLGRKNVCAIKQGDLELPSDIIGVVWTPFDAHGAWKSAIARELEDAGYSIDWKKAMRP